MKNSKRVYHIRNLDERKRILLSKLELDRYDAVSWRELDLIFLDEEELDIFFYDTH